MEMLLNVGLFICFKIFMHYDRNAPVRSIYITDVTTNTQKMTDYIGI